MDLRRLRAGELMTAAFGLVLLVSLFLPWYEAGGQSGTAWESFAVTDVVLALLALAAVALVAVTALQRTAAVALAYEAMLTIAAAVAGLAVVFRVIDAPGDGLSRAGGLWLGLAATLGVLAGSLIAMRDERLSEPGRPTDPAGAPVEAHPEIETLPAPPRDAASA